MLLMLGFPGSPLIGIVTTPLLIYHAEQLAVGAFMVEKLRKWVEAGKLPVPSTSQ
jgi:predicted Na+-dependent transporter